MEEQILVVPTQLFRELGRFHGFCGDAETYTRVLLDPRNIVFKPRSSVENDASFKQLIPYMLFCHTNAAGKTSVFRYVRGKGMGEKRLHGRASVGIGGHLSLVDVNEAVDVYRAGMQRELNEEVTINSCYTERCVGLINDDSTEVGSVHLGVVHRFDLEEPNVVPNETDIIESGFVPVEELLRNSEEFETWSSIALQALFG
ncbi:MAG: phosphoesterase [Planctomycetaceae bacterium]|jgi:predicted NUDIX family phosphoesterase|nr:phosphoesterase [Planctomycetaceae bacterium]